MNGRKTTSLQWHQGIFLEACRPARIRVFDVPTRAAQTLDCGVDRLGHVLIYCHVEAEPRAVGDAECGNVPVEVAWFDGNRIWISDIDTGDHLEQGRDIRHCATHRGDGRDPPKRLGKTRAIRNCAERRLEADGARVRGRSPAGAATIRTEANGREARGDRRRIAAG